MLKKVLTPEDCGALASMYGNEEWFRSRVVMAQHGFGRGEYKYFRYPLPDVVRGLRSSLYERLSRVANLWNQQMKVDTRYPAKRADFIERCHSAGQVRPSPPVKSLPARTKEKPPESGKHAQLASCMSEPNLTNREIEVLRHIIGRNQDRDIGQLLHITEATVK